MTTTKLKGILIAGSVIMLVIVVALGYTSQRSITWIEGYVAVLSHDHEVVTTLQEILLSLQRAESNRRGFVITDDKQYLGSYNEAVKSLQQSLDHLRQLNTRRIYQDSFLDTLESKITRKVESLQKSLLLALSDTSADSIQVAFTDRGRESMKTIRGTVTELLNDRRNDRSDNYSALAKFSSDAKQLTSTVLLIALFFLCGFGILSYREIRKIGIVESALRTDLILARQQIQHATRRYEELRRKMEEGNQDRIV